MGTAPWPARIPIFMSWVGCMVHRRKSSGFAVAIAPPDRSNLPCTTNWKMSSRWWITRNPPISLFCEFCRALADRQVGCNIRERIAPNDIRDQTTKLCRTQQFSTFRNQSAIYGLSCGMKFSTRTLTVVTIKAIANPPKPSRNSYNEGW